MDETSIQPLVDSVMALIQPLIAAFFALIIAIRAYFNKSLDFSGAFFGFLVFFIHLAFNIRAAAMLLMFFLSSSQLTKLGAEVKRKSDDEYKEGGQRNWIQVLVNSGIASGLVLIIRRLVAWEDNCLDSSKSILITALMGGIVGHYACCSGDTWSSEIGSLSNSQPRLITTLKRVRKGTNGGVTKTGLLAAAAGGCLIGVTFVVMGYFTVKCPSDVALKQLLVIPLATMAGLFGSLLDSFLGATLQFSGFCSVRKTVVGKRGPTVKHISGFAFLDNNGVNLVSILITTALTAYAFAHIF